MFVWVCLGGGWDWRIKRRGHADRRQAGKPSRIVETLDFRLSPEDNRKRLRWSASSWLTASGPPLIICTVPGPERSSETPENIVHKPRKRPAGQMDLRKSLITFLRIVVYYYPLVPTGKAEDSSCTIYANPCVMAGLTVHRPPNHALPDFPRLSSVACTNCSRHPDTKKCASSTNSWQDRPVW